MDFGALPPEINSARMYAGAGPGPMMAAAAAWDYLAVDLASSAASYSTVTAQLTCSSWFGPASRSMIAAAAPYISWLSAAAALAEQTSMQAKAVASAFDAAFAMTVPPLVVAENRTQLMVLTMTNFFGQNSAAIAATEASYAEMWAQDAVAMNGYAGFATTASQLAPFTEPRQTTDQAGLAQQQAAVAQAAATAAGTDAPSATQPSVNDIINTLSSQIKGLLFGPLDVIYWPMIYVGSLIFSQIGVLWPEHLAGAAAAGLSATPALAAPVNLGGGLISANLASSTKIGSLSVPTSWYATAPKAAEKSIVEAIGIEGVGAPSNGPEALLRQIAPIRGRRGRGGLPPREYGFRPRFTARPPSAG
ncbi:PPE family protein [Mycobacterium montefiorense]|uniref:PPE family protein n=1 Tax=Mycobacterium montefiorense TaxID=154654 RepID=UPI0027E128C7|nr:PPE family protein [Mycobacterium montefiorense]MCV7427829.1 PPE family protein [Mycobacterium montefiorense]